MRELLSDPLKLAEKLRTDIAKGEAKLENIKTRQKHMLMCKAEIEAALAIENQAHDALARDLLQYGQQLQEAKAAVAKSYSDQRLAQGGAMLGTATPQHLARMVEWGELAKVHGDDMASVAPEHLTPVTDAYIHYNQYLLRQKYTS